MCLIKSSNILMHTDNALHYLGMDSFICWVCWIFKLQVGFRHMNYTLSTAIPSLDCTCIGLDLCMLSSTALVR